MGGMVAEGVGGAVAGGGGDEGVGRQGGSQQQDSGEGVNGTFGEQKRVEIGGIGGSQKPPWALREPGAMPLKVRPSGAGRVPTSSAPTGIWRGSRQRKTALRR